MQYRDSRQEVTGLTVNRKVNVPASYRYTVRAMVDSLLKTGVFEFIYKKEDQRGNEVVTSSIGHNKQLFGMLAYIDQVDLFNKKLCEDNGVVPADTFGRITLFRRFLYFDAFYAPAMPVIICEGKTDNTYISCAIKSLALSYPSLVLPGTVPKLSIRLFKYSDRRTSRVTELTGGVGGLCKLIKHYHDDVTAKFKASVPKHPVIVLIDNDSGANSVYGAIAGITKKKKPTGLEPFIHVMGNLYVVPTPFAPGNVQTMIENFFDDATLKTKLSGKEFDWGKDKDDAKHYSKAAFARDVVAKNAQNIDFSRFRNILDRVVAVINDYAKKLPSLIAP